VYEDELDRKGCGWVDEKKNWSVKKERAFAGSMHALRDRATQVSDERDREGEDRLWTNASKTGRTGWSLCGVRLERFPFPHDRHELRYTGE